MSARTAAPDLPTVLVADDEAEVCALFQRVLRREGYRVFRATGGRRALAALRRRPVDLVILDIRMPDLDGLTVLERIRRRRPDQTVIMLTAYGHIETARRALELGAYDYITKPFDLDFVKKIVREAVGK